MKRILIISLIIILCLTIRSYADNIYISLAPTISLENFDLKGKDETIDKEESFGFNFKAGYSFLKYISLEIDYDFIEGFEGYFKHDNNYFYADMQIFTLMPMFKTSTGTERYKNYFSTGFGYMNVDYGYVKTDLCWKAGIGLDYFFIENFSLGANLNYSVGFGDVKFIEYYNGSLNLSFIF